MITLPIGLQHALESGECVLFVGAGIGKHMKADDGRTAPASGAELAADLVKTFGIETVSNDLSKVAEAIEGRKGRAELETFLKKRLSGLEPDQFVKWIASLRWRAIFTTNYDIGVERAYELTATPPQTPKVISITPDIVNLDLRFDVPVYHIHGVLFGVEKPRIVITRQDYAQYNARRRMLFEILKSQFATSTFVYVGYSHNDPHWDFLLNEIATEFYPSKMPQSYRVAPATDPIDVELLQARSVETLNCTFAEFVEAASTTLAASRLDPDRLKRIQSQVPLDLLAAFEKNPSPVARLMASWTYVNQAPFSEPPNTRAFFRGDFPNWSLIGESIPFKRDLEDEIYEQGLVEYATTDTPGSMDIAVLAPAGFGTSTLLMTLATRLVREHVGPVFMLKPGARLLEGDVEFATTLFDERPFFFVDSAADHGDALRYLIQTFREQKKTAMFVLGERLNEWRQAGLRFRPRQEYEIESLSDLEIDRLLDCLGRHNELDKLEPLERAIQVAVIKTKHGKQLLVAMREATEGKDFDAILIDEYQGIGQAEAQRLYMTVCCFYQFGTYVRDALLARIVKIPLTEMYSKTGPQLEGVVTYDCVDEALGIYAARARHRTIAQIVWKRCGTAADREGIVLDALAGLNIVYRLDKEAFETFIRSDEMVAEIRTLDGKIRFFDNACRKEPDNPYVRQHYARMLLRSEKYELALSQIDEALKMNAGIKVLYHTRGMILSKLAVETESLEVARRRLVQGDEAFRAGISIYDRDEYDYSGLAQLYFNWAKRASGNETVEYLSKAEATITEGLRVVPHKESLWIVSSQIEEWLGNEPSRITALERAVRESSGSVLPRYLLGKVYRTAGNPDRAVEILKPVIANHPDEFRACVEYALALIDMGKTYDEGIAVLRIGTTDGMRDPRFIATLGGMLFMNGKFTDADAVFREARKREFSMEEARSIQFRPRNPLNHSLHVRLEGTVAAVRAGYATISIVGYPEFRCPRSKARDFILRGGLDVFVEPAFSATGPVVERIFERGPAT